MNHNTLRVPIATLCLLFLATVFGCGGGDSSSESGTGDTDQDTVEIEAGGDLDDENTELSQENAEAEEERPPQVFPQGKCKEAYVLGTGPYFLDVTDSFGIGRDDLAVDGQRIGTVDLDGDDYPDLVVHKTDNNLRDDFSADPQKFYKRILLNRPREDNAKYREFVDATEASGFTAIRGGGDGRSCQLAVFADIDNDGDIDAFSGRHPNVAPTADPVDPGDRSEILLGDGEGNFTLAEPSDTTTDADEPWTTVGASFLDFDRDGLIDLWVGFFSTYYGSGINLPNRLYRGLGGGAFEDVTASYGVYTTSTDVATANSHRTSYGVSVCDVNDDGTPDLIGSSYGRAFNELYVWRDNIYNNEALSSNFASDDNEDYTDNQYYICYCQDHTCDPHPGSPSLSSCPSNAWADSETMPWRLGGNTFTTVCGDWTGDGLPDLFNAEIAHWWAGGSSDPSQLLVNASNGDTVVFERPGREATGLTRNHDIPGGWNEGDISALRWDFDLDGYPDLYIGSSDYDETYGLLFRQTDNGVFKDIASKSGTMHERAVGVSAADLDRDGDLDLVVGSSTMRGGPWSTPEVHIYRNDIGNKSNAVRITLEGLGEGHANRSAIGARVKVTTGERTQTEWIEAGYGHMGIMKELSLTVGLGEACVIDELEVRWPNSELTVQTWHDVPANFHLKITEGEDYIDFQPLDLTK